MMLISISSRRPAAEASALFLKDFCEQESLGPDAGMILNLGTWWRDGVGGLECGTAGGSGSADEEAIRSRMGAPGAARRRQMVLCICGNLEVMRFSRGFSQMRQQRRSSREPRHPIRAVLAGGLSCRRSVIRRADVNQQNRESDQIFAFVLRHHRLSDDVILNLTL